MGLDMFLQAEQYISELDEDNKQLIDAVKEVDYLGLGEFKPSKIAFEIGYWRKANAIHGWFVRELQRGEDKCQTTYVPLAKLEELKDICEKILDNNELASELLPTTKGFFFGSYEYDEYYKYDVEKTHLLLSKILSNPNVKKWYITYHASW
jgi:hypothetical protein